MSPEQLFLELRKLNRVDKLRAMQVLVAELSAEEGLTLPPDVNNTLFTPYDDEAASQVLSDFLHSEQKNEDS
jgi:hypothetical protein